jgi:MFS family permease
LGLVDDHPHRWPAPLQALEHRAFRWLWIATFVSNSGSWMQRVATAWLVYSLSGSETWLGVDAAIAAVPTFLLLPISGVMADRVDRRLILVAANIANFVLAVSLATIWWTGSLALWHLLVSSFLTSVVAAFAAPASQAIVPTAAGEDHISNAVALNSFQYNLARAMGPAVSGIALGTVGPGGCFLINALSYLGLVAAVVVLPVMRNRRTGTTHNNLLEGIRFIRMQPRLQLLLGVLAILAFAGAPMVTLLPAIAKSTLAEGVGSYSVLLASFGVGAAIAGLALSFIPRSNKSTKLIFLAAIAVAACHLALPYAHSVHAALLISCVAGLAFVGAMIEIGTELILGTPDHLRGRVSGVQQLCFRAAQPTGGFIAAILAASAGVHIVFVGFAALLVAMMLLLAAMFRFTRMESTNP